jgi:D-aminoacyl-tRNA deacylase
LIHFIASTKDIAGMNIAEQLIDIYEFEKLQETFQNHPIYGKKFHKKETKLIFVDTEIVETQFLGEILDSHLFIFLSRHSSVKGIPTLSVHVPGNLSEAKFGGRPRNVSVAPAKAIKNSLLEMAKLVGEKNFGYDVSYECTHHGPSLDSPAMFVELGSSPNQWRDTKAAEIVAHAAVAAVSNNPDCSSIVLGIGGPHYNKKFTKMALTGQWAFGHVIPKYALGSVDIEIIRQCVEKTLEPTNSVVLDWKGIKGEHKSKILAVLEGLSINSEKV